MKSTFDAAKGANLNVVLNSQVANALKVKRVRAAIVGSKTLTILSI